MCSDAELERISVLSENRSIRLLSDHVTNAGMEKLKAFRRLEGLFLSYTPVGDVGLKAVSVMHHLRAVVLGRNSGDGFGPEEPRGASSAAKVLTLRQPASATADWSHSRRLRG